MIERIHHHFSQRLILDEQCVELLSEPIAHAVRLLFHVLSHDGRVFVCGLGGCASIADYFVAHLMDAPDQERPGLAAIALNQNTSVIQRMGYEFNYAHQIQTLGNMGDLIVLLSYYQASDALIPVIDAAHEKGLSVLLITGDNADNLTNYLSETDIRISIPDTNRMRVNETIFFILHILSDGIEAHLMGEVE